MTLPLTYPISLALMGPFPLPQAVEDINLRLLPYNGRRGAPLRSSGLMRALATSSVF